MLLLTEREITVSFKCLVPVHMDPDVLEPGPPGDNSEDGTSVISVASAYAEA